MDKKTVFVKTGKGRREAGNQTDLLYGDAKRVLLLVDDDSTIAEITKRTPPSLRASLEKELQDLINGGFIRDSREPENSPQKPELKFATPKFVTPKAAPPSAEPAKAAPVAPKAAVLQSASPAMPTGTPSDEMGLDFSFLTEPSRPAAPQPKPTVPQHNALIDDEAAKARTEADTAGAKAAQMAQIEATAAAAKAKAYEEAKAKAKAEVEARARTEAEARAKQEGEAARLKAEREAEQVRAELEAQKARVEAEMRARSVAAARIKQEADAARLKAEQEAALARAQLEAATAKMEAEIRVRVEAEARAKQEADAARMKAEQEAQRVRAELETTRIKAEAEVRARIEAEARAKAEVEARLKEAAEEARLKLEREEAAARLKVEAEARIRAEVAARILQEEEAARLQAAKLLVEMDVAKAKAEAEARELLGMAARIKAEAEARLKKEGEEARLKAEEEGRLAKLDPAEKIRMQFAQAAAPAIPAQQSSALSEIILHDFDGVAGVPAQGLPGAARSTVDANTRQRAERESEERRARAEREAADRLRAEQEAAARLRAQQETARLAAERESARLRAEHEAYRKKVEEEDARAKAEQEARKQADEQSKTWEEAEQRAKAKAQAEKERSEKQLAEEQKKSQPRKVKARRKPLPLGKIAGGLFALALLAVALLPYVWPLDSYVQPLEQELSAQLRQPVHIGKMSAALLPTPKLEMNAVTVGDGSELKVNNVVVNFDFSALFAHTRSINRLQLNEVFLRGAALPATMSWLQLAGAADKYPVARIELQNVHVETDEIKLPLVSGHADFDPQGQFTKAELKTGDGKFGFELESLQKHLQLVVNIRDSGLPLLPWVQLTDLSATGEVVNGEIIFSDLYAHLFGGMMGGTARLSWQDGWLLQGHLIAKSVELQSIFPKFSISGELYGEVNVTLSGAKLSQLGDAPRMDGTFEAKQVVINKTDLETVARFGSRADLARGHTNFDEIKGTLQSDSQGQRLRQLELSSGALDGSGLLDVAPDQKISGKLSAELKGKHSGTVPLILSGTLTEPVVKTR